MWIIYKIEFNSIHLKYLVFGVLAFLKCLKKKEHLVLKNTSIIRKNTRIKKLSVLKSPFSNHSARSSFGFVCHSLTMRVGFKAPELGGLAETVNFIKYLDNVFLKNLNSQYLKISVQKTFKNFSTKNI